MFRMEVEHTPLRMRGPNNAVRETRGDEDRKEIPTSF